MFFSKWTLYQLLIILTLGVLLYFVNGFGISIAIIGDTGDGERFFRSLLTAGILIALVAYIYLIMSFQQKKRPRMLGYPIWSKMPIILFVVGFLSIVLFLLLGMFGPLMDWTVHFRWLLYLLAIYFIWMFFLFVMSIILKVSRSQDRICELAFAWTSIILLISIFIF